VTKLLKTDLYRYQRKATRTATKWMLANGGFALWMEQGTGKTLCALKIAGVLWRRGLVRLVLIVGPLNVIGSWERQLRTHAAFPYVFNGPEGVVEGAPTNLEYSDTGITFLAVNYEIFRLYWKAFRKLPIDFMIVDEGHRIKDRNSKQSKACWRVGSFQALVDYRLELTGTPIGKDEIDLWAQLRFVSEKALLGHRWRSFKRKYLRVIKFGPFNSKVVLRRGAKQEIERLAAPWVYRMKARDYLDLPPVTDEVIPFSLTGESKKAYEKLETEFVYKFGDLRSTTPLAITKMLRLRQVTGGFVGLDDKSTLQLNQDKLAMFADWMHDYPRWEKLVVFAYFTEEIDMIAALMRKMKRSYVIRDGRTPRKNLNDWMKFQDNKNPTTYIAQIAAGGIGTDLFASRVGVFYSNTLSWIDYDQARKRLDRNGQRRNVLMMHFIAKNTIDEDTYSSLDGKANTADRVLTAIQNRRRDRDG
jgi:SNF2 family DNA or RNA helicase